MNVLIACEESQAVCKAFREKGHNAFSCDIQECSGGHPEWHIKGDVLKILSPSDIGDYESPWVTISFETQDDEEHFVREWDLIIAHPPCTYLTVTGNRWFNVERYGEKAVKRIADREEAAEFFMKFANANCPRIVIENPVGVMSTRWRKPDQIIQPYQFGDPFEKLTCLWLKGVPKLKHTQIVEPPARQVFPSGKAMARWYSSCGGNRAKARSKTFPGIAAAMAEQWG